MVYFHDRLRYSFDEYFNSGKYSLYKLSDKCKTLKYNKNIQHVKSAFLTNTEIYAYGRDCECYSWLSLEGRDVS